MSSITCLRQLLLVMLAVVAAPPAAKGSSPEPPAVTNNDAPAFVVDARMGLRSLAALSDGHLQKLADILTLTAASDAARSGQWERIRGPLASAAQMNISGVYWFARPDGTYWTIDEGLISAKLSDRAYFPRLLAGQAVIGELVVSRSTNRNTAIVAVPVCAANRSIVGALGCSVHLDNLTALLTQEMGNPGDRVIFFAIDAKPLGALNSDASLIFTEPLTLGDVEMSRAFREILAGQEGVVSYNFRGQRRTVLYHKSSVSGWWYGFGQIGR